MDCDAASIRDSPITSSHAVRRSKLSEVTVCIRLNTRSHWDVEMSGPWGHNSERTVMPSVVEPETFGTEDDQTPTLLLTPTMREWHCSDGGPMFELRELEDGATAFAVWLDRLRSNGSSVPFRATILSRTASSPAKPIVLARAACRSVQ